MWDLFAKAAEGAIRGVTGQTKKRKKAPAPVPQQPRPMAPTSTPVNVHVRQGGDGGGARHSPLAIAGAVTGGMAFILAAIILTRK